MSFSPASWILIGALLCNGSLPGVVFCVEPSGEVGLEVLRDRCCGTEDPAGGAQTLVMSPAGADSDDSCGPCTDTPVSPVPVTKPARHHLPAMTTVCVLHTGDVVSATPRLHFISQPLSVDIALIPVTTTTLLI